MTIPERFISDFCDNGTWFVRSIKTNERIPCSTRMDAQLVMACIRAAPDQDAEFARILNEGH